MLEIYKAKKGDRKNVKNTSNNFDGDNYIFLASEGASIAAMSKRIIDLDATRYITLYKYSFDTCEEISAIKVWLGDNSMVQAIGIGSIIVEIVVKD